MEVISKVLCILLFSASAFASIAPADKFFIAVDKKDLESHSLRSMNLKGEIDQKVIIEVSQNELNDMSHYMHHEHNKCGGFFAFNSIEQAKEFLNTPIERNLRSLFVDYSINMEETVENAIAQVDAIEIEKSIRHLSSYRNRYYQSQTGVDSAKWIRNKWASLLERRSDANVELYEHASWKQPSVIATIKGKSDDVIVVGGHLDSIAGWFGGNNVHAPGADDNASGISTITEVIRILADTNYVPAKTLKFMGYAAEEVGLKGSNEIAQDFKSRGVNVIGVMQLDMTNFNGSNRDIHFIDDNTNKEQNEFLASLMDSYMRGFTYSYTSCGYACSDHASWHKAGFKASFPFEAAKNDMNGKIHTKNDTIENMGGNADHAAKFAKLALAFVIELDR